MLETKQTKIILAILAILLVVGGYVLTRPAATEEVLVEETEVTSEPEISMVLPTIYPVEHASFVMEWDGEIVYVDPVGEATYYTKEGLPNVVVITHAHGDHLAIPVLEAVVTEGVTLITTQEVYDLLPVTLQARAKVMENGAVETVGDITLTAIPMYNLDPAKLQYHPKGKGNGYVMEKGGVRVYVAGDTEDIPEMRALTDIDIAFVPMNEPYTMSVEAAASAVLEFAPRIVYPYHFRGMEGMSDIAQFTELVTAGNPAITVVDGGWYNTAEAE